MLHVTKFEIKYGLLLCFSVAKKQKLLFICLEIKNFCFAGNTYCEWEAKKVQLVLFIDNPQVTTFARFLTTNQYQL